MPLSTSVLVTHMNQPPLFQAADFCSSIPRSVQNYAFTKYKIFSQVPGSPYISKFSSDCCRPSWGSENITASFVKKSIDIFSIVMTSFPLSASYISVSIKNRENSMGDIVSPCKRPISQLC